MRYIDTSKRTKELAYQWAEYSMRDMLGDEIDTWDEEKFDKEVYKSADIILSEMSYHPELKGIIHDRALTMWQNDMMRVPFDHLTFDDREKAVIENDYWPYKMDKWEVREIIAELTLHQIPTPYVTEATREVEDGIVKKLRGN